MKNLEIENCHVSALRITNLEDSNVSLKNISTYSMDLRDSKIDKLLMDHVTTRSKLKYDDAQVKDLKSSNVFFGKNLKIWNEGSNIEIKPDKILDE